MSCAIVGALAVVDFSDTPHLLPGLSADVDILHDRYGVPHIYAESEHDVYLALGYVHAQDRLWQMEINRRAGLGQLAEVFGSEALDQDRLVRTLGLKQAAQANWQHLDTRSQALVNAYAQGINAYLAEQKLLPVEFWLLSVSPAPWQPVDSLVWLKTMAWRLSGNWWEELLNLRLSQQLSPEQVADLLPAYPGEPRRLLPDAKSLYGRVLPKIVASSAKPAYVPDKSIGSNNWVVNGSRSETSLPLLANDPHLALTSPSLFYFAHLHAPGLNVFGATLPGIPGVMLGRNEKLAWSFTNTGSDTQDLFFEQPLPDDASHYQAGEHALAFSTRQESIMVKGGPTEQLTARSTRHGPVISDVDTDARAVMPIDWVVALCWVGLAEDDSTIRFILDAGRANTVDELRAFAEQFHSPQQNIVYADQSGKIGFIAAGRVPVRHPDNVVQGKLPVPGWSTLYDWQGYIPYAELPQIAPSTNQTDHIVTANQKITPENYPYFVSSSWALPYRAERITELLDAREKHSVDSFADIQRDVVNPVARQLLPFLLAIETDTELQKNTVALMQQWDYRMTGDAAQPLIFAEWIRQLIIEICAQPLGSAYDWLDDYNPAFLYNLFTQQNGSAARWCKPTVNKACHEEIKHALQTALANLQQHYGDNPSDWRWHEAHVAMFKHQPFSALPLLNHWFAPQIGRGGGMDTINVSGYRYDTDTGHYLGQSGSAFRAIYDLAKPDNSLYILPTGQSGHVWSSHYQDMIKLWANGNYLPMHTQRATVEQDTVKRTHLSPIHLTLTQPVPPSNRPPIH